MVTMHIMHTHLLPVFKLILLWQFTSPFARSGQSPFMNVRFFPPKLENIIMLTQTVPCPSPPSVCFFILTGIKALISRLFVPNWRKFWSYDSITSSNSVLLIIYYMYMNKVGVFQVNGGTNAKSWRDLQRKDNNFFFF